MTDAVKRPFSETQLQPQGAQPTAGPTLALQSIDVFVEQHAKFPSGAYALPVWKTPHNLHGQGLFMTLKDHDGGEHPMSTALKTPSTLKPKISLEGTKDQAVEMWTLARKEWEERLSALRAALLHHGVHQRRDGLPPRLRFRAPSRIRHRAQASAIAPSPVPVCTPRLHLQDHAAVR